MILLLLGTALGNPYVLELDSASQAKVPVLGWKRSVTHTIALVNLQEDGGWTHEVCTVEIRDRAPMARTILPDAFVDALPPISTVADLDGEQIRVDLGLSRVGFAEGPLPEHADDANVLDHEGDGRPGATVQLQISGLGTFGLDVVQESHIWLVGSRDGDGYVGTVTTELLDQRVLGADHRLLNSSPLVRPDDERSSFTLRPTSATECVEL